MRRLGFVLVILCGPTVFAQDQGARPAPASDGVSRVLRQVERAIERGDPAAYRVLLTTSATKSDQTTAFIADWVVPGVTRAVVHERLRTASVEAADGQGFDIYVDVLTEFGRRGRVGTWLIGVRRDPTAAEPDAWRIDSVMVLTTVRGLYRLALTPDKEFSVDNFTLTAEDFEVRLPRGSAFLAETEEGVTAIVLMGKGDLTFSPPSEAEKGQVRIYSGQDTLRTGFDSLYVRVSPEDFDGHIAPESLKPRVVDRRDLRRAEQIFQENVSLAFGLDLNDLSREKWSVMPKDGDLVTEIDADRAHLTYMRSTSDPEDIRFFDRTHQRTISIYASRDKLAARGPFFNEDDQIGYDILNNDIQASFDPQREWIDGKARVLLVGKATPISTLTMSLAEPLIIRSVVSRRYGYLMALRVTGQNDVVINLPEPLPPNTVLDLEFVYGGRLHATPPEREALMLQNQDEFFTIQAEPSYIYTGRSYWYPEGQVSDYATANLLLRVPDGYSSVATGALDEGFPRSVSLQARTWKEYRYSATQPVRYLAWAVSKFVHVDSATVTLAPKAPDELPRPGVSYTDADVSVESSGMLKRRALDLSAMTQDVLKFYGELVGDLPYQSFTLAVVERNMPGGHSPPYFAVLSQPPPATPIAWRSDPTYFSEFPEFFVAHEAAHQWWGQAVGWKNYHEQWLSEGFSQYFAALYAERSHRKDVFDRVVAQMAKWTLDRSDQGPVYLGYRLGHLKNDSRVFRALVYNKGALTLHMLRRLIGDEAFFRAVRRFYSTWRFRKAGTEDLKAAFQAESGRPLDRFFDRWIYNSSLPRLKFTYRTESDAVIVRFEQIGEVFDLPVTVTLEYPAPAPSIDVIVPVVDQVTEQRIPTKGVPKEVVANRDNAAPAVFVK